MTEKLYYEDQYIREFTAEIVNIIEYDKEFHIELDKTAFFPGGGGQPSDIGTIEDSIISNVYEKDGNIYHVTDKKPIKLHRARCKIDWNFRFDGMQQHLGQHILSSSFLEAFRVNTLSFHLGRDFCTTDVDKFLSDEELEVVEAVANQNILKNKRVEFFIPSKSELKKLSLRRVPDINDESLRIVKIEDTDITACCGLHPGSTIEVQMIKIKRKEKAKGNMRVEFICGKRAVEESLKKFKFSNKICRDLNCNEEEAIIRINNLTSDYANLIAENKNLKSLTADFEAQKMLQNCEKVNGVRVVKNIFTSADMKYVNILGAKLIAYDNVIALFALKSENNASLMFMCSKDLKPVNMNDLLKDAITLIDGKGGGSQILAQGGGKAVNNLESSVNYAYTKVKNILTSSSKNIT